MKSLGSPDAASPETPAPPCAQWQALVESLPDLVIRVDREGTIEFINRVLPGFDMAKVVGSPCYDYIGPGHRERIRQGLMQVLATGQPALIEVSGDGADGATAWYANHIAPLHRGDEIVGAVMVARDVTAQRQAEARLALADRLATVGTLAAGVAHEINNPLVAVICNLELAEADVAAREPDLRAPAPDLAEKLADARAAADRVQRIVRDLKTFARAHDDATTPIDVRRVLRSMLRLAQGEIRPRARIVERYHEVPLVEANESRLSQAFLNLIVNAAQSIPAGEAEDHEICVSTATDDRGHAVVEVSDTGCGMSAEVQRRLFTPFFTTKPVGEGTGLGLAISHGIVTGYGGEIAVTSESGRGSTFRVSLPASDEDLTAATPAAAPAPAPGPRRRGRVLVIDDDAIVGRTIHRMLAADHAVVATERAAEAAEMLRRGDRFDVILCDLMMPEVTGIDFYRELEHIAPECAERVIFMTGACSATARADLDRLPNACLFKPFGSEELQRLILERLG